MMKKTGFLPILAVLVVRKLENIKALNLDSLSAKT